MHPLPPASDLQFLIGLEIGQVCLDPWGTQIRFADGGQITIQSPFEHTDMQGRTHGHQSQEEQDLGPVFLRELLQKTILGVEREDMRLTLRFENGASLRISSEAIPYESGQIYPPGRDRDPIVF